MNKGIFLSVILFFALVLVPTSNAAAYFETFDSNSGGWETWFINGSLYTGGSSDWSATGGNLDGHIFATFNGTDDLYAFDSPENQFGDLTGQTLMVDYKISGTALPADAKVRWYIGSQTDGNNYFVSKDSFSWDPNADTDWTTHTIAINEANFDRWTIGDAGTKTFAEVVAEGQWAGLFFLDGNQYGISSLDGATVSIDNIGAVPIPGVVWLLGSSLIGIFGFKRKYRK
ncbi:MAG: hypothetical protein R6V46_16615 [Desulfatiglandaceae bacterium]